jgi:plastocyanin
MMDRDPNVSQSGLTGEVRFRVPLPIIVPFGALLLIGLAAFGFSRILLSVPKEIATVIAMVTAANVLGAFAVIALRRNMNRSVLSELAIVVLYPVLIGAVIATMGLDEGAHGEEHAPTGPGTGAPTASADVVTARGSAFDTDELTLTAGEATDIEFINEDTVPHNISVYEDDSASKAIFEGEIITDDEITYSIEAPKKPGEAYFQCDVHPAMNGTATIE